MRGVDLLQVEFCAMKGARHRLIKDLLRDRGEMTVRALARELGVSEATIRRDLKELLGTSGLRRVHGGAAFMEDVEPPVVARRRKNAEEKIALAAYAASRIPEGATVFIGSGSTMSFLAEALVVRRELTVITNACNVAVTLASATGVDVCMTGGALRRGEMSLIGAIAEESVTSLEFETAFMSIQGIDPNVGLTNSFVPEASMDRAVVAHAPRLVILAEGYKLGRVAPVVVGSVEVMDSLITSRTANQSQIDRLVDLGVEVELV